MIFLLTNTGGAGNITIDVNPPIVIPPTIPAIGFTSVVAEKNQISPGDFAVIRYSLSMTQGNYTKFSFSGDVDFESPITVFCEDNYNNVTQDIINPADPNVFVIDVLDGIINESKSAITCNGIFAGGYMDYDVLVKYPIDVSSTGGTLAGNFGVDLYDTP